MRRGWLVLVPAAMVVVLAVSVALRSSKVPEFVKPEAVEEWLESRRQPENDPAYQNIEPRTVSDLHQIIEELLQVYPIVTRVRGNREELSIAFQIEDPNKLTAAVGAMAKVIFTEERLADVKTIHFIGTFVGAHEALGPAEIHLARSTWKEIDWDRLSGKDIRELIPDAVIGE